MMKVAYLDGKPTYNPPLAHEEGVEPPSAVLETVIIAVIRLMYETYGTLWRN